jgi:hypothetical protein
VGLTRFCVRNWNSVQQSAKNTELEPGAPVTDTHDCTVSSFNLKPVTVIDVTPGTAFGSSFLFVWYQLASNRSLLVTITTTSSWFAIYALHERASNRNLIFPSLHYFMQIAKFICLLWVHSSHLSTAKLFN